MISYQSNYFQVVINMSQVPIELYPTPKREWGEVAQLILIIFLYKSLVKTLCYKTQNYPIDNFFETFLNHTISLTSNSIIIQTR